MEDNEEKSSEQLWKDLLDITEKQIKINTQLREIMEFIVGASTERKGVTSTEETVSKARDLFVELEALHAEGRALFHKLFETEE
ncbi:MAG TPA: hypothetical protein VMW37_01790 [Dehalococcoidales bacterium]|nr:hypothetical protein [Dehalococcoidales bacterium]